jgi:hypothetical protein
MPIYYGDDAIAYLVKQSQKKDTQSSSHWNKFHANFNFKGGKFSGIEGFGSHENQYTGFKKVAHYLFQAPFRKMAKQYSNFDTVNRVAKDVLRRLNKGYSLDVLRQVVSLSYLNDKKAVKHEALLKIKNKSSVIGIEAGNHQLIQLCPIDLTINIASMQEMNSEVVAEYFTDISIAAQKHSGFFYCCNRKKILPDGTIVKFED